MPTADTDRPAADPPPVRPYLTDRVHAALVKAGRPVTRGELKLFMVNGSNAKADDIQAALDVLAAEELAARGEERGLGRLSWQRHVVYRAVGKKG
jgi:hypothetical protein